MAERRSSDDVPRREGRRLVWWGAHHMEETMSEVMLMRKSIPVRSVRNRADKSAAELFGAQQHENSAHVWTLD